MKLLFLVFATFTVLFCAQLAVAQCCCSRADVTITNGVGLPLVASDISVLNVSEWSDGNRTNLFDGERREAIIQFRIGCGTGKEVLLIEHQGVVMRIRFKLDGEFGNAKVEAGFFPGDFVIELEKEPVEDSRRTAVIRPADVEEVNEAEEIQKAYAAKDQATYPS